MRDVVEGIGVFVIGRRMFDLTDGWGGRHPFDKPIVVVTPGRIASQCLELGLLDEISIDHVPVMLGSGVRFLDELKAAPILFDGPDLLVEGLA